MAFADSYAGWKLVRPSARSDQQNSAPTLQRAASRGSLRRLHASLPAWIVTPLAACAVLLAAPRAEAQFAVSSTGAPTYSHPLTVPPGVAGMAPKLGLFYAGGGVNGPVGHGWSLQGISAITRCPATVATDGADNRAPVGYAASDKLCLDGQRLIQTNDVGTPTPAAFPQTNDSLGSSSGYREYRTEKDTYARVRAYGIAVGTDAASGPAYFKVWTKAGQVYEYGASPTADGNTKALILAQGKNVAMVWAVARISDTLGTFIDFKYDSRVRNWGSGTTLGIPGEGREWNLIEVQYSGNKVVLTYADRTETSPRDAAEAYHQGSKNVSLSRLQSITSYINSPNTTTLGRGAAAVAVTTTNLLYDNGPFSKRSRLRRIQECAGDVGSTRCLPSATFDYADGDNESYLIRTTFNQTGTDMLPGSTTNYGVVPADFNGDGRTDLLRWADNPVNNRLYISNGDGSFQLAPQFNITNQNLFKGDGCYLSLPADINGDGLTDLLRYSAPTNLDGIACSGGYGPILLYINNGDNSFAPPVTYAGPPVERLKATKRTVCIERNPAGACIESYDDWSRGANFFLLDADGDGKLDIVTTEIPAHQNLGDGANPCATVVCTRVLKGAGDGTFTSIGTNIANRSIYTDPVAVNGLGQTRKIADVDGDGLADLIGLAVQHFNPSAVLRSRGNGNFDGIGAVSGCDIPIDFNGDGRADCLLPGFNGAAASNSLYVADGSSSFKKVAGFALTQPGDEMSGTGVGVLIADINNDGKQDIIRWKDDPLQNRAYISNGDGTFYVSNDFAFTGVELKKSDGKVDTIVGDFLGRGSSELLRLKASGAQGVLPSNQLYTKASGTPPDQLTSLGSPMGVLTTVNYVTLSNPSALGAARYTSDRGTTFAATAAGRRVDLTLPMPVVWSSTDFNPPGSTAVATEYSYHGLKAHIDGRGLLGFRETRRQTPGANGQPLTTITRYLQDHPYIGVASRTETRNGPNAPGSQTLSTPLLSMTENVYCDATNPGAETSATVSAPCTTTSKVQRPYLRQSYESGNDLDNPNLALPEVTTVNTFNSSGDPTDMLLTTRGKVAGIDQAFTKRTVNQYSPVDTATWTLGRLTRAEVTSTVPNLLASLTTGFGAAPRAGDTAGTAPPLTLSLSPANIVASQAGAGTMTRSTTVTVGATPTYPLSFSWTRVSGTTLIAANAASGTSNTPSWTTSFSATLAAGQTADETWRLTTTDVAGRTGTVTISVKLAVSTFTAAIAPSPVALYRSNPGPASATMTATPAGGLAPYSYSWTRRTGTRTTLSSSTVAAPSVGANLGWDESTTESWDVLITDAAQSSTVASVNVNLSTPAAPGLTISPSPLTISAGSPGTASATAMLSGAGGVPPYSYSWSREGAGSRISVSGAQTGTFSATVNYDDNFTESFRATMTDAAGNTATSVLSVTARGPVAPVPALAISPSSWNFGNTLDGEVKTKTFTVTNSGGPGTINLSLTNPNGGFYALGNACPPNGSVMAGSSSCSVTVSYSGGYQCGGSIIQRPATLTATVTNAQGSSSAGASISASNHVINPPCP